MKNYSINLTDLIFQAEKARSRLLTVLNTNPKPGHEYNLVYTAFLLELRFDGQFARNMDYAYLNEITKAILEQEWKKVKREARGESNE